MIIKMNISSVELLADYDACLPHHLCPDRGSNLVPTAPEANALPLSYRPPLTTLATFPLGLIKFNRPRLETNIVGVPYLFYCFADIKENRSSMPHPVLSLSMLSLYPTDRGRNGTKV